MVRFEDFISSINQIGHQYGYFLPEKINQQWIWRLLRANFGQRANYPKAFGHRSKQKMPPESSGGISLFSLK